MTSTVASGNGVPDPPYGERIARDEVPRAWRVIESSPRHRAGKILKRQIRDDDVPTAPGAPQGESHADRE